MRLFPFLIAFLPILTTYSSYAAQVVSRGDLLVVQPRITSLVAIPDLSRSMKIFSSGGDAKGEAGSAFCVAERNGRIYVAEEAMLGNGYIKATDLAFNELWRAPKPDYYVRDIRSDSAQRSYVAGQDGFLTVYDVSGTPQSR